MGLLWIAWLAFLEMGKRLLLEEILSGEALYLLEKLPGGGLIRKEEAMLLKTENLMIMNLIYLKYLILMQIRIE